MPRGQRFITTIFGKTGSGKTTLINEILPALPRPVLILDTMGEFSDGLQFDTALELRDYIAEGRPNATGIYILNAQTDRDSDLFFRFLVSAKAPLTAVVDEIDLFCNPRQIHDDLAQTIKYGRHWGQNLVCASRRAAEVHRNITAQSDCLISFRQTEPGDIRTLKQSYADAEKLPDLRADKYEFLIFGRWEHLPFADILRNLPIANTEQDRYTDIDQ